MLHRSILFAAMAGVLAAAPAWADGDHGRGRGKHKEEFWDGDCKVKREWKKDGGYKEKRKCKGVAREYEVEHRPVRIVPAQPVVVVPAQPAAVYPPWIVMQQGERAYHPEYRPRQVSSASRCRSDTVGQVLGGVVGGALGSQIGKGSGRTAATIGGAVAGVLIGGEIGKRMDASDHACIGQVLEVAPVNHRVQWTEGPAQYVVVPGQVLSRQGSYCRPYTMEVRIDGQVERSRGTACRRGDGVWVAA